MYISHDVQVIDGPYLKLDQYSSTNESVYVNCTLDGIIDLNLFFSGWTVRAGAFNCHYSIEDYIKVGDHFPVSDCIISMQMKDTSFWIAKTKTWTLEYCDREINGKSAMEGLIALNIY